MFCYPVYIKGGCQVMNSFINWIGGKHQLKNEICNRMPDDFKRYIEVFGGAGWVLFNKPRHAALEVYNDANGDLVNLFRIVKFHTPELQRELEYSLNSREQFEDYKSQIITRGQTDIQRAARFFMLIKTSYGSSCRTYGCAKKSVENMVSYLSEVKSRLSNVVIENKDFENLIKVYDRPDALLYLDPPYFGTENYYNAEFPQQDHIRLNDVLTNIKGRFILSYNDCDYIRQLYKNFKIDSVERTNNLVARYADKVNIYRELIIKNY